MKNGKFRMRFKVGFVLSAVAFAIVIPLITLQPQSPTPHSSDLVTWDGALDAFPTGAKVTAIEEFPFAGPNGSQTIALPVVSWAAEGAD